MLEFMAVTPVVATAKKGVGVAAALAKAHAPAGSTGTKFSVDPEQAEQLVKDLEAAVKELRDIAEQVRPLTDLPSPGKDWYSGVAASKIREIAGDNPGGYLKANSEAREALAKTILNIQDALKVYRETEANAQTAMRKG
jgi:hypothetical protein